MADDDTTPPPSPTPDAPPAPAEPTDNGAGGKEAVLADLARERKNRQQLERDLKKLQEASQSDAEKALAAAKAEGRTEGLSISHSRIVKAEIRAAAAGVLQDPDDATLHVDATAFEVDEDGNVDAKAIKAAVDRLAKAKPYLAVGAKPAPLPGGGETPSSGSSMDDQLRAAWRAAGS